MSPLRDQAQHEFLEDVFPGYDQSYVPIWGGYWSDYSGCAWMVLLDRDGQLYILDYCWGAWSGDGGSDEPEWDPSPVTYEQALEELERWEEHLE